MEENRRKTELMYMKYWVAPLFIERPIYMYWFIDPSCVVYIFITFVFISSGL